MVLATPWSLVLLASLAASLPATRAGRPTRAPAFTYPSFANPSAAAYRVTTSNLPLFDGVAVQDSWAGRINPVSTPGSGLFFWVSYCCPRLPDSASRLIIILHSTSPALRLVAQRNCLSGSSESCRFVRRVLRVPIVMQWRAGLLFSRGGDTREWRFRI